MFLHDLDFSSETLGNQAPFRKDIDQPQVPELFSRRFSSDRAMRTSFLVVYAAVLVSLSGSQTGATATSCATDIAEAVASIAGAGLAVKNAVSDCKSGGDASKCSADISSVVSSLGSASADVSGAVKDCGGSGSACA